MRLSTTTANLQSYDERLADSIQKYVEELRSQPPDIAERKAAEALRRTGITTEDGKAKDKIVSWE